MAAREVEGTLERAATPRAYPGRHPVEDWTLVRRGERIPVVIKRTPSSGRKPSKAERSDEVARELLRRGLSTPEPLGVCRLEGESWFVARRLEGAVQIRAWFLHRDGAGPEPPLPVPFEEIVARLGALARRLHDAGVFFRDLSDGNVLVTSARGEPTLWLVDLDRARLADRPVGLWRRLRDLSRPGLNRREDLELLLRSYRGAEPAPAWMSLLLRSFRARLVLWDRFKRAARPWRRRSGGNGGIIGISSSAGGG